MPKKKTTKKSKPQQMPKPRAKESMPVTAAEGAEFPVLRQDEMDRLLLTLKEHQKELKAHKGVYKVDVGYRWKGGVMTGEVAIRVHVKEKKPVSAMESKDVLPREIGGFPVDVIQSNLELQRTSRRNPLIGGVQTRNVNIGGTGTLGAVVFDAASWAPMALSNHHVYVDTRPSGAAGERVNQPGTTANADTIGTVTRSNAARDCAVATLNNSRGISTSIFDFPGGIKGTVDPVLGMRVTKSGVTTGTTRGMIEGSNADEFTVVPVPGAWQELSGPGDSGSIWLEEMSHAAVGLHFAGETSTAPADERAWAKRIDRVSAALNIRPRRKATLGDNSRNGPVAASLGNTLLLGWVGTDTQLNFMRSTDGRNFSGKVTLELSPVAMALTVFKGKFVAAWIGVGNRQLNIMQSSNGSAWGSKVTLGDTSESAPALAVHNGELYIAWRGVGNNQLNVMRSSDGITWHTKRTLGDTTNAGPALASFAGRLRLGWRGVGNNQLNIISSANGSAFSGKRTYGDTTTSRPYLHVHADRLYYAWQGVGNRLLNVLDSRNGTDFGGKITLRETCIDGPGLATLGNDFVWVWSGTDPNNLLNTLLYDLRT